MRLVCWLAGVWGTVTMSSFWLSLVARVISPASVAAVPVRFDGHLYDDPTFELVDDLEYERRRCVRCGTTVTQGWRYVVLPWTDVQLVRLLEDVERGETSIPER